MTGIPLPRGRLHQRHNFPEVALFEATAAALEANPALDIALSQYTPGVQASLRRLSHDACGLALAIGAEDGPAVSAGVAVLGIVLASASKEVVNGQ